MLIKKFAAVLMCCLMASSAIAQEAAVETTPVAAQKATEIVKVMLTEDGVLKGKAVLKNSGELTPTVKVTLSAEGKVVDAVETDEKGNFSFANVAPGAYQMLGSADGMVGSAAYDVVGYSSVAGSSCSSCALGMAPATSDVVYDSFASAPVSSFATGCNTCGSTCGGGLGGGSFGGRLGGRLGGGLLSNGRIGLIGLAGLAGLGGDDSSPDR